MAFYALYWTYSAQSTNGTTFVGISLFMFTISIFIFIFHFNNKFETKINSRWNMNFFYESATSLTAGWNEWICSSCVHTYVWCIWMCNWKMWKLLAMFGSVQFILTIAHIDPVLTPTKVLEWIYRGTACQCAS